jgi:hypothetical protein
MEAEPEKSGLGFFICAAVPGRILLPSAENHGYALNNYRSKRIYDKRAYSDFDSEAKLQEFYFQ